METKPSLAKCLQFLSLGKPKIKTVADFKKWINENQAEVSTHNYRPGKTTWGNKFPFYTQNLKQLFPLDYLTVKTGQFRDYNNVLNSSNVDSLIGVPLLHGYMGYGHSLRSVITAKERDDVRTNKISASVWDELYISVDNRTIGVKFYFWLERENNAKEGQYLKPHQIVILNMSVRVGVNGDVECVVIHIQSNKRNLGGHASGSSVADETYIKYSTEKQWKEKPDFIGSSYRECVNPKTERDLHMKIKRRIVKAISD